MTEQELKECISEVKYSDMPKPTKKMIMNVLYEQLHKSGWIPCNEGMPEKGETVVACTPNGTNVNMHPISPECDCQLRFCL